MPMDYTPNIPFGASVTRSDFLSPTNIVLGRYSGGPEPLISEPFLLPSWFGVVTRVLEDPSRHGELVFRQPALAMAEVIETIADWKENRAVSFPLQFISIVTHFFFEDQPKNKNADVCK